MKENKRISRLLCGEVENLTQFSYVEMNAFSTICTALKLAVHLTYVGSWF